MEPIVAAVLANDPSRITAAMAAERLDEDLSPTWDPPAQRRLIDLLVSAGAAVDAPDRGGVTPLHRAVRARSPAAAGATLADVDRNGIPVTGRIQSQTLRQALAAG